jgi:hypothetical protein
MFFTAARQCTSKTPRSLHCTCTADTASNGTCPHSRRHCQYSSELSMDTASNGTCPHPVNSVRDPLLLLMGMNSVSWSDTVARNSVLWDGKQWKDDVASPVSVLVYSRKDIGRWACIDAHASPLPKAIPKEKEKHPSFCSSFLRIPWWWSTSNL